MQKYNLILSDRFHEELDKILQFIAKDSPQNALKFRNALYGKIFNIKSMPYRFRQSILSNKKHTRDLIFKGYILPFIINEKSHTIEILGIYKNNVWDLE